MEIHGVITVMFIWKPLRNTDSNNFQLCSWSEFCISDSRYNSGILIRSMGCYDILTGTMVDLSIWKCYIQFTVIYAGVKRSNGNWSSLTSLIILPLIFTVLVF